jgi:peptide/nickel transport system substrate-binding protein
MIERRKLQYVLLTAILSALVLGAAACAGAPVAPAQEKAQEAEKTEKVLTVATGVDVTTIDPQAQAARWDAIVASNIADGLLARDAEMNIVPALAESWDVSEDGRTLTFHLRKNVKFHNGEPFNAEAVKFSVDRLMNPDYQSQAKGPFVDTLKEVSVIDDYTVSFVFENPNAVILPYLVSTAGYLLIVPPKYISEVGEEGFIKKPIGTGPYKFVEWRKDDRLILEANPDYWKGKPEVDRVIFRVIPEAATRVAALISGEVDIVGGLSPDDQAEIDSSDIARTERVPSTRRIYIGFQSTRPPYDDVRVRKAINMAVDVDAIVENILGGNAYRMTSPVISFEFGANKDLKPYPYDPEQAKELLKEAGYPEGFSATLDTPFGRYIKDKEVAEAVAGYLREVGIDTKVEVKEWATYISEMQDRKLDDMFLLGWGAGGLMDADLALQPFFSTTSARPYSVQYVNPEVDALIIEARSEMDRERRAELYKEALKILHDEAVWLFLYNQADLYGVSNNIAWQPRSDEAIWAYDVSFK